MKHVVFASIPTATVFVVVSMLALIPALGAEDTSPMNAGSLEWRDALEAARELRASGDFQGALRGYRKAQELAGDAEPIAMIELAATYSDLGLLPKAAKIAQDALGQARSLEGRAAAGDMLAVILLRQDKPKASTVAAAEAALREAVSGRDDIDERHALHLGQLLRRRGDLETALVVAERALTHALERSVRDPSRVLVCDLRRAIGADGEPPTSSESDGPHNEVLDGDSDEVHRPRKIHSPPPKYTPAAEADRVQGVVIIEAIIDREGCVAQTRVLKDLGTELATAASEAVSGWVFEPARRRRDGAAVSVVYNLTVNFELR